MVFLAESYRFWWGLHLLGIVFGLGAATVTDVMFLHFMRNFRIERREAKIMETLSKIIWVGLGLLLITGFAMWIPQWEVMLESDRFLMKMTTVVVVLINGIILNLWIQPRARRISFLQPDRKLSDEEREERVRLRRTAFALGGISVVAWYGAFALAVLDMVVLSYGQLFLVFFALIAVAIVGSQIKENQYREKVVEELDEEPLE